MLTRNLGAAEIVQQFMAARDSYGEWPHSPSEPGTGAKGETSRLLSTIVLMGMGEPLYNYENVAKAMTIVVAVVGVVFTIGGGSTIVTLLLMGYSFVTQLFPSAVMSLRKRNPVTAPGAFAGIFVGVATVAVITLNHYTIGGLFPDLPQWIKDLNIGIVALVLNVVTLTIVSALTQPGTRTADVIGS
jgi:hypothetical protein